jgi:hypothetical protein
MERFPRLPAGPGERHAGYGVLGLSFASGHVLAFRRLVATSLGPPFTTAWHRDPEGSWTFHVDGEPRLACPRYFGSAVDRVSVGTIDLTWIGPDTLCLSVADGRLDWVLRLRDSLTTRALGAAARLIPSPAWTNRTVLTTVGSLASRLLESDGLQLAGRLPNGQRYRARPLSVWTVEGSAAVVEGRELGPIGPLRDDIAVGPFPLPGTGLFAAGQAVGEPLDAERHSTTLARQIVEGAEV